MLDFTHTVGLRISQGHLLHFSGIVCFSVFDTAFHQTCIISLFRTNIQQVIAANIVLAYLAILYLSYVHNGATGELTCSNYFSYIYIPTQISVQNFMRPIVHVTQACLSLDSGRLRLTSSLQSWLGQPGTGHTHRHVRTQQWDMAQSDTHLILT